MLFKILTLGIIFFVLRNLFRSWQTLQEVDKHLKSKKRHKKAQAPDDKPIDAEYTVVDDK